MKNEKIQNTKVGKCCYTKWENDVIQSGKMMLYKVGKEGNKKIGICDQISHSANFFHGEFLKKSLKK